MPGGLPGQVRALVAWVRAWIALELLTPLGPTVGAICGALEAHHEAGDFAPELLGSIASWSRGAAQTVEPRGGEGWQSLCLRSAWCSGYEGLADFAQACGWLAQGAPVEAACLWESAARALLAAAAWRKAGRSAAFAQPVSLELAGDVLHTCGVEVGRQGAELWRGVVAELPPERYRMARPTEQGGAS